MLTAETNRLGFARGPVKRDITTHIRWLEKRLTDADGDLTAAIAASPLYRAQDDLLRSVPCENCSLSSTRWSGTSAAGTHRSLDFQDSC